MILKILDPRTGQHVVITVVDPARPAVASSLLNKPASVAPKVAPVA